MFLAVDTTLTYGEYDLYYTAPPHECNGFQLEAFWLHERYWGGVQRTESYYRVKVPIVLGPNGIPVAWRELRVIPLADRSLIGFSVSHCKVPDGAVPLLMSDYVI